MKPRTAIDCPPSLPSPAPVHARIRAVGHGLAIAAVLALGLAGCLATGDTAPMPIDQRVVVEGRVASVDLSPMAYDGNALVVVDGTRHGAVTVHLPARRNLCKAQGFDLLPELKAGDRVHVEGLATGPAAISVCLDADDTLRRIE